MRAGLTCLPPSRPKEFWSRFGGVLKLCQFCTFLTMCSKKNESWYVVLVNLNPLKYAVLVNHNPLIYSYF